MRTVRKMRHWKQRFDKDADFTWIKPVTWQGKQVKIGDKIPKTLTENRNKLRRFWEAGVIQLSDFSAPDVVTGQKPAETVVEPDALELVKHADRKWSISGYDEVYTSKGKAKKALDAFNEAAADDATAYEAVRDEADTDHAEWMALAEAAAAKFEAGASDENDDWLDGDDETDNAEEVSTEEADEAKTDKET